MRTHQVLIPASLALLVAACGGGNSSSTSANAPASTPTNAKILKTGRLKPSKRKPKASVKAHPHRPKPAPASQSRTTTSAPKLVTTTQTSSTKAHHHKAAAAPVLTRPLQVKLVGQDHHPVVNKKWWYTVTATDARGRPLSGRVETDFSFQGTVVGHETPPTHQLTHGRLHDGVRFPARAVGEPLAIQVVVHTQIGSKTLVWSVRVKK